MCVCSLRRITSLNSVVHRPSTTSSASIRPYLLAVVVSSATVRSLSTHIPTRYVWYYPLFKCSKPCHEPIQKYRSMTRSTHSSNSQILCALQISKYDFITNASPLAPQSSRRRPSFARLSAFGNARHDRIPIMRADGGGVLASAIESSPHTLYRYNWWSKKHGLIIDSRLQCVVECERLIANLN